MSQSETKAKLIATGNLRAFAPEISYPVYVALQ